MDEKIVKRFFEVTDDVVERLKARIDNGASLEYSDLIEVLLEEIKIAELSGYRYLEFGQESGEIIIIFTDPWETPEYYAEIFYGSCPGCDALQDAQSRAEDGDLRPLRDLLLHIVQRMKRF